MRGEDRSWERFEELRTPTFFSSPVVVEALRETGWTSVAVTSTDDLITPIDDQEKFNRGFFAATS